ncbi:MAG: TIGR01777 family oxidoreductase [Desulfomonilaceae bacterium]
MNILITGGAGFVGSYLTGLLSDKGHKITIISRHPEVNQRFGSSVSFLAADCMKPGSWQNTVGDHDVVVNLAGVSINKRWDENHKRLLRDSRILTTRYVVDAIPVGKAPQVTLVNASGVGYYGFTRDEELSEDAPPGSDFLARLARDWEAEAQKGKLKGARVIIARLGIVLGRNGGALNEMIRPFRYFVGGPLGNGLQWFPWIHIYDLCQAITFSIEKSSVEGPINCVAPTPVRNCDLAKAIGKVLKRPRFVRVPAILIRLMLGEFGSVILEGQRALPKALLEKGFKFRFVTIEDALTDLL